MVAPNPALGFAMDSRAYLQCKRASLRSPCEQCPSPCPRPILPFLLPVPVDCSERSLWGRTHSSRLCGGMETDAKLTENTDEVQAQSTKDLVGHSLWKKCHCNRSRGREPGQQEGFRLPHRSTVSESVPFAEPEGNGAAMFSGNPITRAVTMLVGLSKSPRPPRGF